MESTIITNIVKNVGFTKNIINKLKKDDFEVYENQVIFEEIKNYHKEYSKFPTLKELGISLFQNLKIKENENLKEKIKQRLIEIKNEEKIINNDFLIDITEKQIKRRRFIDLLIKSSDDLNEDKDLTQYIEKFEKTLSFKLKNDLGISIKDVKKKLELYSIKDNFLSTGVIEFDDIMGGGFKKKALTVFSAPSNYGKTAFMIYFSGKLLKEKNGIYYSLEMPMEDISKRIDASLLNEKINDIDKIPENDYIQKFNNLNLKGELYIKDYPANELTVFDIENDVSEIENSEKIKIDFIVIDYLGIMKSTRAKFSQGGYVYYKAVAEELHSIAKKLGIAVITSSQLNRSAFNNTDAGMSNVSDSIGVVQTADNFISIVSNDELYAKNELILKFEKSRSKERGDKVLVKFDFARVNFNFTDELAKPTLKAKNTIKDLTNEINGNSFDTLKENYEVFSNTNSNASSSLEDIDDFDIDI